jgi:hypothetical protein
MTCLAWEKAMHRFEFRQVLTLCAALLLAAPSLGADGQAVGVDPDAVARLSGADRVLTVGADVSVGEQIVTGAKGQVQIVFSDGTRLVVAPGSALVIESYLFNGRTADKFAVNALAGGFRFITGKSPKPAYSIKTPTASIAVRGTQFDFNVTPGRTDLLLYEGAVRLCSGATCTEITDRCALGVTQSGGAQVIGRNDAQHAALSREFRYARFQTPLQGPFRISGASQCTQPSSQGGPNDSLSTTSQDGSTPTDTTNTPPGPTPPTGQTPPTAPPGSQTSI